MNTDSPPRRSDIIYDMPDGIQENMVDYIPQFVPAHLGTTLITSLTFMMPKRSGSSNFQFSAVPQRKLSGSVYLPRNIAGGTALIKYVVNKFSDCAQIVFITGQPGARVAKLK